jgi:hypothetical protein
MTIAMSHREVAFSCLGYREPRVNPRKSTKEKPPNPVADPRVLLAAVSRDGITA